MEQAMRPLKDLMDHTERVRITGPGTDLRFSILGIPTIPCGGEHNIPDGEIFHLSSQEFRRRSYPV